MKELDSAMSETTTIWLTRHEIANIVGGDISERTIRYWEQEGLLPKAQRMGRRAMHPVTILPKVRALASTRPSSMSRIRRQIVQVEIEDQQVILRIKWKEESNE